jgi:hypothetical protein
VSVKVQVQVVVEVMDQLARQFLAKRGGPKAVLRRWPVAGESTFLMALLLFQPE